MGVGETMLRVVVPSMTGRQSLAAVMVVAAIGASAGCSATAGGADDDWSRSYLGPYPRVLEAVLDTLEANGFYIDSVDEERGRVRAESSARRGDQVTLLVEVERRGDRVRVDVMVRSSELEVGRGTGVVTAVVREFHSGVSARLEGLVG